MTSRVERLSHDGRAEAIDYSGPLHVALEAEVRNAPESRMHIPLPRTEGSFDLARHPGYNDFRYFLDSELMDNDEAFVHFNILAGFRPDSLNSAASVTRHVSPVSRGERHANAQGFARQAARRIAGELTGFLGPRRLELNLETWTFDRSENRYRISMVVSWRRGVFGGVSTRISGELTVGEGGENAMFMLSDGNRDGLERWISRFARRAARQRTGVCTPGGAPHRRRADGIPWAAASRTQSRNVDVRPQRKSLPDFDGRIVAPRRVRRRVDPH